GEVERGEAIREAVLSPEGGDGTTSSPRPFFAAKPQRAAETLESLGFLSPVPDSRETFGRAPGGVRRPAPNRAGPVDLAFLAPQESLTDVQIFLAVVIRRPVGRAQTRCRGWPRSRRFACL